MAADESYNATNYEAQGGAEQVIGSGGSLTVYGSATIKSGGSLTMEAGSALTSPVTSNPTTATAIAANGVTVLSATAAKTWTLEAPYSGCLAEIHITTATSTRNMTILTNSTGTAIGTTGANKFAKTLGAQRNKALVLRGVSATQWHIVVGSTNGTISKRST